MSAALIGRISAIAAGMVTTGQRMACIQSGGEKVNSTQNAKPTITAPRIKITKTAGPSPASCAERSKPQTGQRGRTVSNPSKTGPFPQRGQRPRSAAWKTEMLASTIPLMADGLACRDRRLAPPVNAAEQEQPHHVHEVTIPSGGLETEVPFRREVTGKGAEETHRQKQRADDHVKAVKPGGQEKHRRINPAP